MLLQYAVSNFGSIGHPIVLNMFPTDGNSDFRFLKTLPTSAGDWEVLQRGGIFGPNASGKSSLIKSISFAKNYIVSGQKSGKNIRINQFRGTIEELHGISTFQFAFFLDNEIYEYGFSLDRRQVHEEWLFRLVKEEYITLFSRTTNADGQTIIDLTDAFPWDDTNERTLADVLIRSIKEEQKSQLFLYKLYDNGIKQATQIINWFKNIQVIFPNTSVRALPLRLNKNDDLRTFIGEMLTSMDTGITSVTVPSREIDFHEFAEKLSIPEDIRDEIEDMKSGIFTHNGKSFVVTEDSSKRPVLYQMNFNHQGMSEPFDLELESDGTKRLLDLLPILFLLKRNSQSIFFVDEIDRSLHTKLSQHLLNTFIKLCKDTYSQLIFTAHDVNLLNLENFRQEELWFIEKNRFGESQLRPLSDFQLQKEQNALKSYLSGRFGAVPVIKEEL